jgi:GT2 family glycosyltransferase/SAM-dependent methyltransferase
MKYKDIQLIESSSVQFTGERFVYHDAVSLEMKCEHLHRYLFASLYVKGMTVLDIASGEGYGSHILSQSAKRVSGVDIDPDAVASAGAKYRGDNLEFVVGNCLDIPFEDQTFDAVVSFETIEHIRDCEEFVAEVKRVLKKGGIFICSSPNRAVYKRNKPDNEFHLREMDLDEFVALIGGEFDNTSVLGQSFELGSRIGLMDAPAPGRIAFSNKDKERVRAGEGMAEPEYVIVLASDASLPEAVESTYDADCPRNYLSALRGGIAERDQAFLKEQERLQKELASRHEAFLRERALFEQELASRDKAMADEQARLEKELAARDAALVSEQQRLERELDSRHEAFLEERARMEQEIAERDAALVAEQTRLENELAARHEAFLREQARLEKEIAGLQEAFVAEQRRLETELNERDVRFRAELERQGEAYEGLKEANVRLEGERDRFRLYFNQQVEYSEMLKQSLSYLRHLLATMAGDVVHVRNSLRWKIGTAIIRFFDALQWRFKSPSRLDRMDRTIREFRDWEAGYERCERQSEGLNACDYQCFALWDKAVVSVIIPVYNQYEYTKSCITSVVRSNIKVPYEIIVADDLSDDETLDIAGEFPFVKVVRNELNLGFLRNCNNAARSAEGEYLLFLNNDTQVMAGWLESLYETMEADPSIAICGSKLVYPDGTLQEAGGILWKDGSAWNYGRGGDPDASQFNYLKEADYISGASIMVRRTFWDEVGGFDERYAPAYCEDSDLAFEARAHGHRVVYQPKSVVIHYEGKSHGTDVTGGLKAYQVENGKKFYAKWKHVLERDHLPNGQDPVAARDRTIGKQRVLYVDHYVPHFDQDAGSKTALHYLRLLRDNDVAVTFLGDNFARHEPYTEVLQQMGIEVLYGVEWYEGWEAWFSQNSHLFSQAFLNRPHIARKYVEKIRAHSDCRIVYYGHDLHFLREQRAAEREGKSGRGKEVQKVKEMELDACRLMDVCYYPSSVEAEVLRKELPDKVVKAVPAYIYDAPSAPGKPFAERKGVLFVGGFGHPPNSQAVEYYLEQIHPLLEAEEADIPFYVVGSRAPEWLTNLDRPNVCVKGFVSEEELRELYGACRLVVAPLLYGAGVKGKVVEALHYGVPVITTAIGAEGLADSEAIVVRDQARDFADAVLEYHGDASRLEQLSEAARRFVQAHFTSEAALRILDEDFGITRNRR